MRWDCLLVAMLATPALAQTPPAAADDREAIVCGLTGSCTTPEAAGDPAAATPRGTPRRSGATRGFSFTRPGQSGTATAPGKGAAASPGRATATAAPRRATPGKLDLRINFVTGSAEVSPGSRTRVATFASALLDPRLVRHRVRIEGHTDSVGDAQANLDLSRRRAEAVAALVTARGVDRARLDVEGYGDTQKLAGVPGTSAANRRVVAALAD